MGFTIDTRDGMLPVVADRKVEDKNSTSDLKVFAYRDIITENGLLKKGEVGYIPRSWIQRVINGRCSCEGKLSWFKFI